MYNFFWEREKAVINSPPPHPLMWNWINTELGISPWRGTDLVMNILLLGLSYLSYTLNCLLNSYLVFRAQIVGHWLLSPLHLFQTFNIHIQVTYIWHIIQVDMAWLYLHLRFLSIININIYHVSCQATWTFFVYAIGWWHHFLMVHPWVPSKLLS